MLNDTPPSPVAGPAGIIMPGTHSGIRRSASARNFGPPVPTCSGIARTLQMTVLASLLLLAESRKDSWDDPSWSTHQPLRLACKNWSPQVLYLFEKAAAENQSDLLLATDGSSENGIGAFAVACQHPCMAMAGADSSEDQTPFRMELLGILGVLDALAHTDHPPRHVTILVDCESAMKAICCPEASQYSTLAAKAQRAGAMARSRGTSWTMTWVPSHGKKPNWAPVPPLQAASCRLLNQTADDCANAHRRGRLPGSDRSTWHQELLRASLQEKAALQLSARTSTVLEAFICTASESA